MLWIVAQFSVPVKVVCEDCQAGVLEADVAGEHCMKMVEPLARVASEGICLLQRDDPESREKRRHEFQEMPNLLLPFGPQFPL